MISHTETRHVPYTPRQMFDLVADVERYPEFIPWCSAARARDLGAMPDGGASMMEADLVISFKVFRERYTSRILLCPPESNDPARIEVEAISGPFKQLTTNYTFNERQDGGCDMVFQLGFAFSNRLMQRAAGAAFEIALRRIARAFEERAAVLYGGAVA